MAELFNDYLPWLAVLVGMLIMGVGWLILRSMLRLTMKLTIIGCVVILGIGCAGAAVALYLSL